MFVCASIMSPYRSNHGSYLVFFLELGHVHTDEPLQSHNGLTSILCCISVYHLVEHLVLIVTMETKTN